MRKGVYVHTDKHALLVVYLKWGFTILDNLEGGLDGH